MGDSNCKKAWLIFLGSHECLFPLKPNKGSLKGILLSILVFQAFISTFLAIRHYYGSHTGGIFAGGYVVTSRSISSWMLLSAHVYKIICQCLYLFEVGSKNIFVMGSSH